MDVQITFPTIIIIIICLTLIITSIIFYNLHHDEIDSLNNYLFGGYYEETDITLPIIYNTKPDYSNLFNYDKTKRISIDDINNLGYDETDNNDKVIRTTKPLSTINLKLLTKPNTTKPTQRTITTTQPIILPTQPIINNKIQILNINNTTLLTLNNINIFDFESTVINGQNYFYLKTNNSYIKHNNYDTITFVDNKNDASLFYIISTNNSNLDSRINSSFNINNIINSNRPIYLYMFNKNIQGVIDINNRVINSLNNPNNAWKIINKK